MPGQFTLSLAMFLPEERGGRVFRKDINLPFVPAEGLDLELAEESDPEGFLTFTISQPSYDLGTGKFQAINTITHAEDVDLYLRAGFVEQIQPGSPRKRK